jgi:hypothetical protein
MMPRAFRRSRARPPIKHYVEAALQLPGFSISWETGPVHVAKSGAMDYLIERQKHVDADRFARERRTRPTGKS